MHPVRPSPLLWQPLYLQDSTYNALGSDVDACVWGVVEVCLAILSACTPTFPALFRWRSLRRNSRPREEDPKRSGLVGYPALVPDERRSGFRSGVRLAHGGAIKMDDWSESTTDEEQGTIHVEGRNLSDR